MHFSHVWSKALLTSARRGGEQYITIHHNTLGPNKDKDWEGVLAHWHRIRLTSIIGIHPMILLCTMHGRSIIIAVAHAVDGDNIIRISYSHIRRAAWWSCIVLVLIRHITSNNQTSSYRLFHQHNTDEVEGTSNLVSYVLLGARPRKQP